jgi:hypothetical protein
LLQGFRSFGSYLPGVAVPLVQEKMREKTANAILPAEEEQLIEHLRARYQAGLRMNLNLLGEALLGEEAAGMRFRQRDGSEVPKFVCLDMEEYHDMRITAEAFMRTLERPGLAQARAGIALQAYLPDAYAVQRRINDWARSRVQRGGAPITVQLVNHILVAMLSYQRAVKEELGREHDHFGLLGQDHIRRYVLVRNRRIRVHSDDSLFHLIARIAVARTLGYRVTLRVW